MTPRIRRHGTVIIALLAVGITLVAGGCAVRRVKLNVRRDKRVVKLRGVESVKAKIVMRAGELTIDDGGKSLLAANFTYSMDSWKPRVDYDVRGKTGELTIKGPKRVSSFFQSRAINHWDLRINNDIPLELSVKSNLGDSNLQLGDLNLYNFKLSSSAGDAKLDFDGDWNHDVDVDINTSMGDLLLRLPEDFGVRVDIDADLSDINAPGFKIEDGGYVNDAYADAKNKLDIRVKHQAGDITLEMVD